MRVLLVGDYGVENVGDEALRDYFLWAFPEIEWVTLSANPKQGEYPRLPAGLRSFFSLRWIKTIGVLRRSDAMVFGGGSLFTDSESKAACFIWWIHAVAAVFFGKSIFLAFQGVGPFRSGLSRWFAGYVIRHAAFISVRDEESFSRVKEFTSNQTIVQTFDPVFSLMQSKKTTISSQKVFTAIPRFNGTQQFLEQCQKLVQEGGFEEIHIVLLQPDDKREQEEAEKLKALIPSAVIISVRTVDEVIRALRDSALVITQRYHGGLFALGLGIKTVIVPQKPGDKLDALKRLIEAGATEASLLEKVRTGEDALREALKKMENMRKNG